jgi:IS1 family transposase
LRNDFEDIEEKPPVMLPTSKLFKDSGWVAMYNQLTNVEDRVGMIFISSPFGSQNHSHPHQNSFVIQAYGEYLAIDSDYYDAYHSTFDKSYNKQTFAHNSITFDGGVGQPRNSMTHNGYISEFLIGTDMSLAGGNAKNAVASLCQQGIKGGVNKKNFWLCGCPHIVIHSAPSPNFFKVNVHSAFVWVKSFAKNNYSKPAPIDDSLIIELDEMWRFLRSKKDEFGSGRPTVEQQNSSSIKNIAHEIMKHLEKMYERFKKLNVKIFFSDHYSVYRDFIPLECLIQTKNRNSFDRK